MPHLTEIVLVALIVMVVFGVGKLPNIGLALGRARADFKKGLAEGDAIDITPEPEPREEPGRKPGRFEHDVEDAELDEPR
jgi:sec-independent protein translocase protein TatA